METIGERLLYTRTTLLSLSQKNFATILGISQGALSEIEQNKRGMSMEAIINLIEYSKQNTTFSYEWILTGSEIVKSSSTLSDDEKELLCNYNELDPRGKHRVHTIIYEELDRIDNKKNLLQEGNAKFISSKNDFNMDKNA